MEVPLLKNINKEKEKWNKQKNSGRKKFILIHGVLFGGVLYAVLYSIFTMFLHPKAPDYTTTQIITRFIAYAMMGGLAGVVIGSLQWNAKVKKFGK